MAGNPPPYTYRGWHPHGDANPTFGQDTVQVQTYWHIGRHIVEFEQGGAQRAAYGQRLLPQLGQALAEEFGRGFDASNLRYMRLFYQAFPIRDALRHELSWTHYRLLLRVDSAEARQWYAQEAAAQNWSTRALERQISKLVYPVVAWLCWVPNLLVAEKGGPVQS